MSNQVTKADEVRSKILDQFKQFEPQLAAYHEYAERVHALSVEYHGERLKETFPQAPVEELVLLAILDTRATPRSLDSKLEELAGASIKRIIYDRTKATYYIYV